HKDKAGSDMDCEKYERRRRLLTDRVDKRLRIEYAAPAPRRQRGQYQHEQGAHSDAARHRIRSTKAVSARWVSIASEMLCLSSLINSGRRKRRRNHIPPNRS